MFKKTKVREILGLLNRGLSEREIAETLAVSRNTVSHIRQEYEKSELTNDDIGLMSDEEVYRVFYPYNHIRKEPAKSINFSLTICLFCFKV